MNKFEEIAALIIDDVCEVVEEQHPEIDLNTDIAKESNIEDPAVICGVPYYDLECRIADDIEKFIKKIRRKKWKKKK